MKKKLISLLLASSIIAVTPVTAYADEVSDEELANEEAEAIEEEVVTDNRIIPNGISIGGTDVSGKTVTEAEDVVNNYFADYDSKVFTLSANGQTFTATGKDLSSNKDMAGRDFLPAVLLGEMKGRSVKP